MLWVNLLTNKDLGVDVTFSNGVMVFHAGTLYAQIVGRPDRAGSRIVVRITLARLASGRFFGVREIPDG